ncbi:MAG: 23S rRNA (guanosine(2251)-2'-O)-methyltransferase RlmB [Chloroflexota bacterium]|nr:23S rRNA (guanosine(2251)-2'-O)-methyltransferase RlmB [Chloroflexota bacterium]
MEMLTGRNPVLEGLRAGRRAVQKVILARGIVETDVIEQIRQLCDEKGIPVSWVDRHQVDQMAGDVNHQGVLARVSPYPYRSLDELLELPKQCEERPFFLVLDSLKDPQNLGSLSRTAEAVGVHGIILPKRRSVSVTEAVSRASVGAIEYLHVAQVTNLARALDRLKEERIWIVGVEDHPDAQDYREANLDMPLALVLGSEGKGMRRLTAEKCDLLFRIPMVGHINSLNVSVAGSIMLYRAWEARQHD